MRKTVVRFVILALFLCVLVNSSVCNIVTYGFEDYVSVSLGSFFAFGMMAPFVVAALEFGQFMNRRNLDTWFSFPISRRNLFLVHFLNGAIQLSGSIVAGILVAVVKLSSKDFADFDLNIEKIWMFFLIDLCLTLFLYMVLSFLFVNANNVVDGCIFMLGSVLFPACLFSIFKNFYMCAGGRLDYDAVSDLPFDGYGLFSLLSVASDRFSDLIKGGYIMPAINSLYMPEQGIAEFSIAQVTLWMLIGIAAMGGAVYVFTRKKTEDVSGVSESWFGYRTLIPVCSASALCGSALSSAMFSDQADAAIIISLVGLIPTFIGIFIAYVIYRRGIRFKLPDFITIGGLLVFYIICLVIFKSVDIY